MKRRLGRELMDDPDVPRADLDTALGYIRRVNVRLGGVDALVGHLRRWSARWDRQRPIRLLDVGTGSADLPLAAVKWARGAGFDLHVTGLDSHATTLDLARAHVGGTPGIELIHADALTLDDRFAPGSFDYAHAGLFLHHLPDDAIVKVLRSMDRIAARGIVWNDLVRSRVGALVIRAMTVGRPRIVAHDARASVLAGFTRDEALAHARNAGIGYARYEWSVWTHRFTLAGQKPGHAQTGLADA